jgi:hypothetical protein
MSNKSLRRERFENVAAKRTQKILDLLDILGNCANRSNYEYTDEDVRKMFSAIKEKTKSIEAIFGSNISREVSWFKVKRSLDNFQVVVFLSNFCSLPPSF